MSGDGGVGAEPLDERGVYRRRGIGRRGWPLLTTRYARQSALPTVTGSASRPAKWSRSTLMRWMTLALWCWTI